ncbi:succinate--hydroxymethylglutarate CoA-transferase [Erinaceus europaeus]|uniref:Succinate--hydroxymethylglutarate CoA-transferase n=1 Tax=Erinaceus europaeus TaxID=9365 RepID=A0ABM3XSG1_ERIEU|nr:succinate--hydroxymethylglutarate CoA-transferase [Erinaceus europaeus]
MQATVARVALLRRTGLVSGRGGGRGLWSGRPQSDTDNMKPLEGVRILDLTRVLAGPFATMNLGDLGAEVIKVERPGVGDDTRAWGPPFVGTESTYFLSVNRNKKSIAVNIKDPKGVKIIKELAAVSDVFVENYIPGKLRALGLGYEDIEETAPHIVYCSITGYGQTGPLSHRAGYDAIASAVSGLMHITGPEDGDPVRPGVAMTDLATGLYACGAIMAGLIQRRKTGKGLFIDCNLMSSQVACLTQVAANYLISQEEAKRWGTAHGSIVPYQDCQVQSKRYKQFCCLLITEILNYDLKANFLQEIRLYFDEVWKMNIGVQGLCSYKSWFEETQGNKLNKMQNKSLYFYIHNSDATS